MCVRKLRQKVNYRKRIFSYCFVFARRFPEIMQQLHLFKLLLKHGSAIVRDNLLLIRCWRTHRKKTNNKDEL
ncbi:hypothetical protein CRT22_12895 [Escherichia sp. E5028]|nr:hypothetical protein CRT22_12895 [Escherichia sp. E5028]